MRTFLLIILTIFFLIFHAPGYAYYQWYDHKGIAHYTDDVPPADAKKRDGSGWWETEIDQEEEKKLRKKINNGSAPEPKPGNKPMLIKEDFSQKPGEEEPEDDDNDGFFKRLARFFSKEAKDEDCKVPWLVKKLGICPLGEDEPNMDAIGNKFKAVVINKHKGVWSDCRGTHNNDIITFVYKGQGYWETDGNVPECSFYRGFYWK